MRKHITLAILSMFLVQADLRAGETPGKRNVILFLGDGMSIATITAARIHAGQLAGGTGEEHQLSFEAFPNVALVKTYAVDRQVPDSAGTMSAIVTGQPGSFGVLNVAPGLKSGDCASALEHEVPTLLERAEQAGFQTGIVTTTSITHATPAATYAHSPKRSWENDSKLPEQARSEGCRDIARQLVEFPHGDGIEVALAGGRRELMPITEFDPEYPEQRGKRLDGRNLIKEWLAGGSQRKFVWSAEQFASLDPNEATATLGLFEPYHMMYELDRRASNANEPDIVQMTEFAIRRLNQSDKGFFLMVEGGRIDHAHHGNNAARALTEAVMLDRAVARALELTDAANTLIVVTADHSHTLTMSGYPPRGNPILGTITPEGSEFVPDMYKRPYTTLGYANGPGYKPVIPDLRDTDTTDPNYLQFAGWPMASESHNGEDVAAYANGLGAERLRGVIEQRRLYEVLSMALLGE